MIRAFCISGQPEAIVDQLRELAREFRRRVAEGEAGGGE